MLFTYFIIITIIKFTVKTVLVPHLILILMHTHIYIYILYIYIIIKYN